MHILITGGCGYIGSHIAVRLIEQGYQVTILDTLFNSKHDVLDRIFNITKIRPEFIQADVRDRYVLQRIFDAEHYDAVIHLAGLKSVSESCANPLMYYDNNVNGSLQVVNSMKQYGIKNIIIGSSATVYGASSSVKLSEDMPITVGTSPYAQTKITTELLLRDAYNADKDMSVGVLRYFNPAGAHPSGLLGEDPEGVPDNLLPYITQVVTGKREYLTIYGNDYPTPDGTCIRDYIHIADLAEGHVAMLKYMFNHPGYHVYNLGSGKGVSVKQIVDAYNRILDKPIPYRYGQRRQGDIAEYIADITKAEKDLNWRVKYTIEDIVKDAHNWQCNISK